VEAVADLTWLKKTRAWKLAGDSSSAGPATAAWDTVRRRDEEDVLGDGGAGLEQETCRRETGMGRWGGRGFRRVGSSRQRAAKTDSGRRPPRGKSVQCSGGQNLTAEEWPNECLRQVSTGKPKNLACADLGLFQEFFFFAGHL
jgi:hypothetical protein